MKKRVQAFFEDRSEGLPTFPHETWLKNPSRAFQGFTENILTAVPVPVGLAGPFYMKNDDGKSQAFKKRLLPLATTEAALVASVNRGAKALRAEKTAENGQNSAKYTIKHVGITRAPAFVMSKVPNEAEKQEIKTYFKKSKPFFNQQLKKVSKHTQIITLEPHIEGKYLLVRFYFDTSAAMGMNMATIAARFLAKEVIEPDLDVQLVAVSSNWCADKKPSAETAVKGRKFLVTAEKMLTKPVLSRILKTNAAALAKTAAVKLQMGSGLAKLIGHNAHHANIIAAAFIALGQDPAHTVEGSLGSTLVEKRGEDVMMRVTLPALVCGTLGGGTRLPVQRSLLGLTGVLPNENAPNEPQTIEHAQNLAQLIAGGVLAGEISLLASISAQSLALAHEDLRKTA